MSLDARKLAAVGAIVLGLGVIYRHVFPGLVDAWFTDGNYSHGFLIPPLAGYFVWERRQRLAATSLRPTWVGLLVLSGGILVLVAGLLGSELFLSRVSVIGVLAGIVLFLFGWRHLRILAFPLGFLLLMVPLPAILFNQIALPLQFLASRVGEFAISSCNIPVLREGNVLIMANATLEVAEACSGIRSLVSLVTLALVYGYFSDSRTWVRVALTMAAVPVAIIANGARVAGTGIAAHWIGAAAAQGFLHEFSGWLLFIVAFVMLLGVQRVLTRIAPPAIKPPNLAPVKA